MFFTLRYFSEFSRKQDELGVVPFPRSYPLRVTCPNFGHPPQTSSFTKYKFLQIKNVNELSV